MRERERDLTRLKHMLDALNEIDSYRIKDVYSFENSMLKFATAKQLEIVGEAARNVSDELKAVFSEVPWQSMIGMRNNLSHEYFRVDLGTMWSTVKNDLPMLRENVLIIIDHINAKK